MDEKTFSESLRESVPEVPELFDHAMRAQLDLICRQEAESPAPRVPHVPIKRRLVAALIAALLLLTAAALAASLLQLDLFEATIGAKVENGKTIMQYDLAHESFGDYDIDVLQAAYDGMSLYVVYSITDRTATATLGSWDDLEQKQLLDHADYDKLHANGLSLDTGWIDGLWIDGQDTNIPGGTTGSTVGTDQPGQVLCYTIYPLHNEGVYLTGSDVEITLPIGPKPENRGSLPRDPDTGLLLKPETGGVSFHLDCSRRDGIQTFSSEETVDMGDFTATLRSATFTPVQVYIIVDKTVKPEAMAQFIAENGDGYYDENGTLLYPYDGMELSDSWAYSVQVVDAQGQCLYTEEELGWFGCQGHGATMDEYTFPYKADFPDRLYLAPVADGTADMTRALRIR